MTAVVLISWITGDITKIVMKRANPTRTEFGGTCCVPIAVLRRENTIMILRKAVTDSKKKGISEINPKEIMIWMLLENWGELSIPGIFNAESIGNAKLAPIFQ